MVTTVKPASLKSCRALRPTFPAPWMATVPATGRSSRSRMAWVATSRPLAVACSRPSDPPMATGLPGDHGGHRVAHVHGIRVHDPGHHLHVGAHVRGRNVAVRTHQRNDFGGVAAREVLQFMPAQRARIDGHAALGPAVGQVHHGALPRHPHGQGANFVQVGAGVVADAALGRTAG